MCTVYYLFQLKINFSKKGLLEKKENSSACVGEFSSSRHDVSQISSFFSFMKFKYEKFFHDKLAFRLVVIDYSFASIHAVLDSLNRMEIIEYANHILLVSSGKAVYDATKSYLVSCVAHTMKRFTKTLKKIIKSEDFHQFMSLCFSLLLNCTTLDALQTYFEHICVVFRSRYKNKSFCLSFKFLQSALEQRPNSEKESLNKILRSCMENDEDKEDEVNIIEELEVETEVNSKTIKSRSPFTKIFFDISSKVVQLDATQNNQQEESNPYFSNAFVDFLIDTYMPYCFIWASLAMDGYGLSRMSN